jgi:hypothetical protein
MKSRETDLVFPNKLSGPFLNKDDTSKDDTERRRVVFFRFLNEEKLKKTTEKTTFVVRPLILRGRHWHLSFWPKTTSWLKLKIKKLIKFSLLKRRNWALITTNFLEKLLVTENMKNSIPRLELDEEQVAIFQLRDKAKGLLYSFFFLLQ